ncbi:MAG TPA: nuclear transport factor 2 family protein [Pyrinomonadaceae bacterium]|nr:nuclear transport factor 2 family protein [Pyrinomonadaceae bacterium]
MGIKKHLLLLAILVVPIICVEANDTGDSHDIKELQLLEKVWNDAHLRGDVEALDKLWAEDLFVTMPDMPVMNKEESLAVWKSGKTKFDIYRTSDIRIRVYGNSAVVTGQLVRIRDASSKKFEDDWRFTKVYVRRGGRWQVVTWHGSHVGSP